MTLTLFPPPKETRRSIISLSHQERLHLIAACLLAETNLESDARLVADLGQGPVAAYLRAAKIEMTALKTRLLDAEKI